jgi:hypothetical protein
LHKSFQEPDIIKLIKISRFRWFGHLMRRMKNRPARRITEAKQWGRTSWKTVFKVDGQGDRGFSPNED